MFEKDLIADIISLSEEASGLQKGAIRWGLSGRNLHGQKFMCVQFSVNDREFINILSPVSSKYKSDSDMAEDIIFSKENLIERVPVILSTYGMANLLENVASKGMKFMYIIDPEYVPQKDSAHLQSLSLN